MIDKRRKPIMRTNDSSDNERIRQLEKELARLSLENELLKKWQRYLAEVKPTNSNLSDKKKSDTE